ncbi:MAG TPA: serine/threonine-protein kinase, partial [Labilithrix sp.]|nr:serine/threonine-protein kinase [Labilithrix sp.]
MSHRFVRCPHCKMPHDAAERVCPTTGRRMPADSGTGARSRMSELPPPERRPEPLGFDPAKNRIAEAALAARPAARPATATLAPTRNLQQDLIGRAVSDRYMIRGVLGEGGMGTVYEAEHIGLGRQVAIKVLNPSQAKKRVAVKRFQQEARAAGAIGHPNICEVYDLGLLDDGSPYLVMEKLIGTTLADRISREGGLPFDEIADVMVQVLSGLIAAHDKGIVHRDIKPENIFLARRVGCPPIVKILDFGVSKMMPQFQGGDEQLDLTRTGMVMGTPYYMSPEQARGERNLDGRVDVYACGVMMYESIVGKRPFLAPNYNALLLSIINTVPRSLREVRPATPPAFETIVGRMMAKARDDRYPTANAVLRDIQALPIAAAARMPPPPAEERGRGPAAGGGRLSQTRGSRVDRAESPGATLRSRMADAPSPGSRVPRAPDSGDKSTRLDINVQDARAAAQARRVPGSDSYEIPIHVTSSDLRALPASGGSTDFVDEMPTEIFRPGMHPSPVAPSRSPNETRIHRAPAAPPANAQAAPPARRPPPPPAEAPPPPAMAPVNFSGLTGDDWDSETVVKKPAALTTMRHRDRPP